MSNLNHGTPWLRSFLMTYSRENMVVVQVGAWDGSETAAIVSVVENMNGKLIVMDWFKGNVSMDNQSDIFYTEDETQINYRIKRFWSYISKWCKENGKDEKVIRDTIDLRIGNSHDLIPELEDESIDFFHLDGAHEYEMVKKDIELAYPKVKPNGFISGDDYSGDYHINKIDKVSKEDLDKDSIEGIGFGHDITGNIIPNVHAGVVKAVYEHFDGNIMYNLPQSKWCHFKDTNKGNFDAYKVGTRFKGIEYNE